MVPQLQFNRLGFDIAKGKSHRSYMYGLRPAYENVVQLDIKVYSCQPLLLEPLNNLFIESCVRLNWNWIIMAKIMMDVL